MRTAHTLIAFGIVGLTSGPLPAQQDMQDIEITTTHVAGGIYMLQGRGGNLGLSIGEDGAFLVDDQFAPLTEKIIAAIRAVTDQPVQFVFNTHWHGDHTGGNENLGKAGALIVAHENVRKRLNPADFRELMGRSQQAPPDALPVITFTDQVTFHWNGETIHAIHVPPAHTDGDALVHFVGANVVHMGDLFFNGRYPFIDTGSGGNANGVIAAASAALEQMDDDTKVIPGHGALASRADLLAYRDMLVTVRDRVRKLVGEGKSEDQVVAAKPTADLDAIWGERSERFVRAMYQAVARR